MQIENIGNIFHDHFKTHWIVLGHQVLGTRTVLSWRSPFPENPDLLCHIICLEHTFFPGLTKETRQFSEYPKTQRNLDLMYVMISDNFLCHCHRTKHNLLVLVWQITTLLVCGPAGDGLKSAGNSFNNENSFPDNVQCHWNWSVSLYYW